MEFSYEVKNIAPNAIVVQVQGVLDAGTCITLKAALFPRLEKEEMEKVILHIPKLFFISSAGLRIVIMTIKALSRTNGKLYMVGALPQVVGLIKRSGLDTMIHFRDSIEECE